MSNPFINVHVQPSYGKNKAVIVWTVEAGYESADFYVFKSFNKGIGPWELVNETAPAKHGMYIDNSMDMLSDPYYRLLMIDRGVEYDSPVVGVFDKLSKTQFGGVRKMMHLEYLRMSSGNGIQVLHYIPLVSGELNSNVDPLTYQKYGYPCKEDDEDVGLTYKGGFAPPIYTWVEIKVFGEHKIEEASTGLNISDTLTHQGRMLAFPRPNAGDLLIHPSTDNRYVLTSSVQGNLFRGICPISYDVGLQLLHKNDPRYKVVVPPTLPTPLWAKYE